MAQVIDIANGLVVTIRRPFEPAGGVDEQRHTKDGEPIYYAEAMVAGELASPYNLNDAPGAVRIRLVGGQLPAFGFGAKLRLIDPVARSFYNRPRGAMVASNIQIECARVEPAGNEVPAFTGGIPVAIPSDIPMVPLVQAEDGGDNHAGTISFMVAPVGRYAFTDNSVLRVRSTVPINPQLLGNEVRPVDLRLFYSRPDQQDISATRKAEFVFVCRGVEAPQLAGVGNGHRPSKRAEPTPPAEHTPSEG